LPGIITGGHDQIVRIGIDATCWPNRRGYGRFLRELLAAMISSSPDHEYVLFIDSISRGKCTFPDGAKAINVPLSASPVEAASSSGSRSLRDMRKMGRAVAGERLDVFFFPSVYTYFPVFSPAKKVIAIHDVIPEMYPEKIFPNGKARLFWNLKMWAALRQADLILTVSDYSKQGIHQYLNVALDKIEVTVEAAAPCFQKTTNNGEIGQIKRVYGISASDNYFLYVGGVGPHKNLETLIAAFRLVRQRQKTGIKKLVIVGDFKNDAFWMDPKIQKMAGKVSDGDDILFPGFVPDEHLGYLYAGAEALIMPSFSEGFGLPALEAMACGTAVIGSETTSLPEIVGEAGLYFDPTRPERLAECMDRIGGEPLLKNKLGSAGLARAKTFTWERSARIVLNAITKVAGGNHG
jgi:glycosyltransferase involved in cell wall biosynthesis